MLQGETKVRAASLGGDWGGITGSVCVCVCGVRGMGRGGIANMPVDSCCTLAGASREVLFGFFFVFWSLLDDRHND